MHQNTLQEDLQQALYKGWKEFKESEDFVTLSQFSVFLSNAGFYESDYRNIIPHPAYDNGAKKIGKYFLEALCLQGISLESPFPGDFSQSLEKTLGHHEARIFTLNAYKEGRPFCSFKVQFPHVHGSFDYPSPPVLSINSQFDSPER